MKFLTLTTALFLIANVAFAQCNNPYYNIRKGTQFEMTNYDKKDKLQSKNLSEVLEYSQNTSGFLATISFKSFDKKDKLINEGKYNIACENGLLKIDMSSFVPDQSMTAFQDMEVEVVMDQLELPANLDEHTSLKDASISIKTMNNPIPIGLEFDITDRKVTGKETITTPAGTFDCAIISSNVFSKVSIMKMDFTTVDYIAEKVGTVRTETFKGNGNLGNYSLLTMYKY